MLLSEVVFVKPLLLWVVGVCVDVGVCVCVGGGVGGGDRGLFSCLGLFFCVFFCLSVCLMYLCSSRDCVTNSLFFFLFLCFCHVLCVVLFFLHFYFIFYACCVFFFFSHIFSFHSGTISLVSSSPLLYCRFSGLHISR